jgi:hypothetical protein
MQKRLSVHPSPNVQPDDRDDHHGDSIVRVSVRAADVLRASDIERKYPTHGLAVVVVTLQQATRTMHGCCISKASAPVLHRQLPSQRNRQLQ